MNRSSRRALAAERPPKAVALADRLFSRGISKLSSISSIRKTGKTVGENDPVLEVAVPLGRRSRHPGVPTYGVWGEPYSLAGSKLMLRHNLDFRRMRAPKGG